MVSLKYGFSTGSQWGSFQPFKKPKKRRVEKKMATMLPAAT